MKKKYIIALEDRNVWSCGVPAKTLLLSDVSIFGTDLSSVNTGIELTPYTEPDLEQIKRDYDDWYEKGLNDAWEAARKIWEYDTTTLREIFGEGIMRMDWFMKFTASEAIKKIRQYEQGQEEIKVGDEVKSGNERYVVLQKYLNNIDEPMAVLFNRRDGEISYFHLYNGNGAIFEKTGRHFPEVAEVLQKMGEE